MEFLADAKSQCPDLYKHVFVRPNGHGERSLWAFFWALASILSIFSINVTIVCFFADVSGT